MRKRWLLLCALFLLLAVPARAEDIIAVGGLQTMICEEDGTPTYTFTIHLNIQPTHNVTVQLDVSDNSEVECNNSDLGNPSVFQGSWLLGWSPSTWQHVITITVRGRNDTDDDGQQPWTIVLSEVQSLDTRFDGKELVDPTGTTCDDDGNNDPCGTE